MVELFKRLESAPAGTEVALADALAALRFNDAGLVPAIAQDHSSGEVLMLAWMNRDAIEATLESGRVTYWSRSRAELWRKGDTSGHVQELREFAIDCDGDALLLKVAQTGPACHTNRRCCFYLHVAGERVRVTTSAR